ncbi:AAA family ATPase [Paenibacillus sp. LMG 31461]|uniref:AAA family ATPase n=1 Tax=Paenibacillus plantarum TaxID=2654975 RepID=A0ABX1X385_9BACL|nr:ATP-binding protein [Paenibacillus plantarum]NOU62864.1 AAA family ATPase [Paenibacillus plantarum]
MISSGNYTEFSRKVELFRSSDQDILYVIGDSGAGKTSAALEYIKENGNNHGVLYSVLPLTPTLKTFGTELLSRFDIPSQKHINTNQIIERVVMGFKTKGTKLLIIDDFQRVLVDHKVYSEEFISFINILSGISEVKIVLLGLPEIRRFSGRREVFELNQMIIASS